MSKIADLKETVEVYGTARKFDLRHLALASKLAVFDALDELERVRVEREELGRQVEGMRSAIKNIADERDKLRIERDAYRDAATARDRNEDMRLRLLNEGLDEIDRLRKALKRAIETRMVELNAIHSLEVAEGHFPNADLTPIRHNAEVAAVASERALNEARKLLINVPTGKP